MIEKVEGIVVSEKSYGETSKIINLLTKEYGVIGIIAKGAKTLKSPLRSVTEKLCYGEFTIYYKKDKLSLLKEVHILDSFKNIRKDITLVSYSSYLIDLAAQVWMQNNDSNIYDVLISSLDKINNFYDPLIITNIVEIKYLDYLGVMISLTGCAVCGNTNVVTLSATSGGYLCNNCRTNEPIVSDKTMKLIRMYYYVDLSKIEKINISQQFKNQINEFIKNYYEKYTGLYIKSRSLIDKLS